MLSMANAEEAKHLLANTWALHELSRDAVQVIHAETLCRSWFSLVIHTGSKGRGTRGSLQRCNAQGVAEAMSWRHHRYMKKVESNREYQRNHWARQKAGLTLKPRGRNGEPPAVVPVGRLEAEVERCNLFKNGK
eukprot:s4926_g5.t1